jgi:small subunit ribosomal protein S17
MTQAAAEIRMRGGRRVRQGVVASNKCDKTITVHVSYTRPHKKYGKLIRHRTALYAHDEKNEARPGDTVEIMESRRISKLKTWRLVRVVRRSAGE